MTFVQRYQGLVFSDKKVGCLKVKPVHIDYEQKFTPKQTPLRNSPAH